MTAEALSPEAFYLLGPAFIALFVVLLAKRTERARQSENQPENRSLKEASARYGPPKPTNFAPTSLKPWSPEYQMKVIAEVGFERQRALNKEEARVLYALEPICEKLGDEFRLLIQPSLGELLRPKAHFKSAASKRAYSAINSKRLDFGIIDRFGYLVAAIEYQGSGHYNDTSFMRDAVKREALRKAGLDLIEIRKGERPSDLERRVLASVNKLLATAEPEKA